MPSLIAHFASGGRSIGPDDIEIVDKAIKKMNGLTWTRTKTETKTKRWVITMMGTWIRIKAEMTLDHREAQLWHQHDTALENLEMEVQER